MLGLGSSLLQGGALRSIVRSGLQLFYKADRTQAPLGEEQLRNNSFDELGPDKIDNGNFETNIDGWTPNSGDEDEITYNSQLKGIKFSNGASGTATARNANSDTVTGEWYKLTYKVLENNNASNIAVWNGSNYGTYNDLPVNVSDDEHVYYFNFSGSSALDLYISLLTANSDITLSNIKLEKVDPNDRWTVLNPDTSAHTVEIREGETYINYDHDGGTQGSTGINQSGVFPNTTSKYKIEVELGEVTGQLKIQTRGIATTINSSDSNTTKVILLDSSSDSQTHIFIVRLDDNISGSAFVKNVSVKEITNSIKDHSRNSNDGILYSGKALDFDGTDDIVELNDANLTGEFTVCTWIKPDTFTNCVVFGDTGNEDWIRLQSATSITVKIAGNSTGYAPITHGGNIAQDEWSRLIVTRGSDNIVRFGINGTLYSPSTTARAGTFDFNLLGSKDGTEMNGALADVQVYDKAWTASDVEFDYNNPDKDVFDNSNSSIVVTDCKSLLRLNEGAGDRVYDAAPVLGEDLMESRNGSFELGEELNDLTWIGFGGWSTDGDIASNNGDGGTFTNAILELGKTYQFKCKLSSYTSGEFSLFLGRDSESSRFSGTDEFTFTSVCTYDTAARVKSHNGIGSLSISSLTIKEVPNWVYASSVEIVDSGVFFNDDDDNIYQNFSYIDGATYAIGFEGTSDTGLIRYRTGFAGISNTYQETPIPGTAIWRPDSSSQRIQLFGPASGTATVSKVTIKQIKPAESFAIVGDKNFIHQQPYIPQYAMSSFSKKMLFDGVNDYVTGSFNGNIGPAKDITFSCWFSYEDSVAASGDRETLFGLLSSSGDGFPSRKLEVGLFETNRIVVYTGDGTTATSSSTLSDASSPLSNNKLNHIAVSLSSSGVVKIYVNGVESGTATHSNFGAPTVTHYRIGSRTNASLLNKGIIDEVSLFKSELTQAEVLELYNSGSSFDSTGHSKYNLGEEVSNSNFELGSEEVVNGGIDSISNWTFGDGWSLVDGKASLVQVSTLDYLSQQLTGLVNGRTYVLSFDLDIISATTTTIGVSSTGAFGQLSSDDRFFYTSGRKTITAIYDSSHQSGTKYLRFVGGSNTEFTIDNVSVKEVPSWSSSTASSATMSVNTSGQLVLASDAGDNLGAYSSISLVQGRTYVLSVDIISCNVLGQIRIGTSASVGSTSPDDIFNAGGSGVPLGTNTYTFTASATQSSRNYLYIGGRDDVNSLVIDNVSLQEYGVSGYWRNNGADQWDDLSINSNHGTVSGSPTEIFLQEVPFFDKDSLGMFMNKPRLGGLNFAKNGWVEVRDNVSLDVASTNAISVCCWYRANSAASYDVAQYLVNSETYSNAGGWTLIAGTTQIVWTAEAGGNASIGYDHNDMLGWQYIVATYDEQNYRLFTFDENGDISVTTPVASTSALVDEYPINIGGFNEGSGSLINGVIDDIKIYNKALTQAEIKKNYNATKGKHKN